MPYEGPEPIIDAVIASLKAGMPAAVDAVNQHWRDEPQIVAPAPDAYYPGGWSVLKYPSVEVAIADYDLAGFSLAQLTADLTTPLVVRGWVQDAKTDPGRLYRRALRFAAAIVRVLIEPQAFGTNAQMGADQAVRGAFRFNPETEDREELEASCLLVFSLDAVETRV